MLIYNVHVIRPDSAGALHSSPQLHLSEGVKSSLCEGMYVHVCAFHCVTSFVLFLVTPFTITHAMRNPSEENVEHKILTSTVLYLDICIFRTSWIHHCRHNGTFFCVCVCSNNAVLFHCHTITSSTRFPQSLKSLLAYCSVYAGTITVEDCVTMPGLFSVLAKEQAHL